MMSGWEALAIAVWLLASLVVWIMCVVGGVRTFNRLQSRGWRDVPAVAVAVLASLGLICGGWIGYVPYLVVQWIRKRVMKATASQAPA